MNSKHVTAKGVSNSLRGFFERILKPYISNKFVSIEADANKKHKMDYIGTIGSLAVFKKSIPSWKQLETSEYIDSKEAPFVIEHNKQIVFDSSINYNGDILFKRAVPKNAKYFNRLNSPLLDTAIPLSADSNNSIFINPGDGSVQNVFYISPSSNTETFDGEVTPIGSIKIDNATNLKSFRNYYYYSTAEDRPTNCGLYSLTTTSDTRIFTLKERVLDSAKLREKLVEVLGTTDEELETKITSIRILDIAHCVPTGDTGGRHTGLYKAYCMLLEVNEKKLISVYSYFGRTSTTVFNDGIKQIDAFDIPNKIKLAKFRVDAFSAQASWSTDKAAYDTVLFTAFLETPIVTYYGDDDKCHVYRFIFNPRYKMSSKTNSSGEIESRYIDVLDKATVTFQEVDLGDFANKHYDVLDIINNEAKLEVNNFGAYTLMHGNSCVATNRGLISFNTLSSSQHETSVTISEPESLGNFYKAPTISCNKIIKICGNEGVYTGFLSVGSGYKNLRWTETYYSPDGLYWFFVTNNTNALEYTLATNSSGLEIYGSTLISNKDLIKDSIKLSDLMDSDSDKIFGFTIYNKKEINPLNLDLNSAYARGYSESEALYLVEADKLGESTPEIRNK